MEITEAIAIAPKPTGLIGYRWARLNSMKDGLIFRIGLLMMRSATTAPIHAIATLE